MDEYDRRLRALEEARREDRKHSDEHRLGFTRELAGLERRLTEQHDLLRERRDESRANDARVNHRLDRVEGVVASIDGKVDTIVLALEKKQAIEEHEEKTETRIAAVKAERRAVWELRFKIFGLAVGIPAIGSFLLKAWAWLVDHLSKHHP